MFLKDYMSCAYTYSVRAGYLSTQVRETFILISIKFHNLNENMKESFYDLRYANMCPECR